MLIAQFSSHLVFSQKKGLICKTYFMRGSHHTVYPFQAHSLVFLPSQLKRHGSYGKPCFAKPVPS
ncbi:MAG: hypothetical protein CR997_07100 [Acidobacteria bacterium]|nr:MAG: hypothetical protein CR997_07100 [Acidobacteriota bacterium]